ncbi:hypothetical protein M9H77_19514 [Catharanthus roseus]|uniref:Uncharacterized protein n=1 Tax=Catharanthus roseus TaxID=4058 RepID=A0ACC0BAI9_CATRO|nr:hypothetical protein M9H77_19514 [Catharanthus roseus]
MKGSIIPSGNSSWGYSEKETRDMIEQAKEELQILETQQPKRFNYLKLELKSFISHLESQKLFLSSCAAESSSVSIASDAATQESSNSKKRKKVEGGIMETAAPKQKLQRVELDNRTAAVVERARACLHKIQEFKTSFI